MAPKAELVVKLRIVLSQQLHGRVLVEVVLVLLVVEVELDVEVLVVLVDVVVGGGLMSLLKALWILARCNGCGESAASLGKGSGWGAQLLPNSYRPKHL